MRKNWTPELVKHEVEVIAKQLGHFPSNTYLLSIGRNDLAVQITRHGGFIQMAAEIGIAREHSDSDTGWEGEREVMEKLVSLGHACEGPDGVRSPFDIMVDDVVRIDVKSAKYASYGACCGWFYRIGKYVQSDIIILHQLDTKDDYIFFWWEVAVSNMTISRSGGKYHAAKNAYWKIAQVRDAMIALRQKTTAP